MFYNVSHKYNSGFNNFSILLIVLLNWIIIIIIIITIIKDIL